MSEKESMDLNSLIEKKISSLPNNIDAKSFRSILNHIQVAENHFQRATEENIEYLFNDVIYRTNQAFEGGLREAYRLLTESDKWDTIHTWKIEEYFSINRTFSERVMKLFTNYRKEWRNESTHDYNLKMNEEEAFFAICTVSAFVSILMDEILFSLGEKQERQASKVVQPSNLSTLPLIDRVEKLFVMFAEHLNSIEFHKNNPFYSEAQVMGMLSGFLSAYQNDLKIEFEKTVLNVGKSRLRIDLLISDKTSSVVIELKARTSFPVPSSVIHQLLAYAGAVGANGSLLFSAAQDFGQSLKVDKLSLPMGQNEHDLRIIYYG